MPVCKVTLFSGMQGPRTTGWSTNYYYNTGADDAGPATVIEPAKTLFERQLGMCSGAASPIAIRVAVVDEPRKVAVYQYSGELRPNAGQDTPWQACLIKFSGSILGITSQIYLRGLSDAETQYTAGGLVGLTLSDRFEAYRLFLSGSGSKWGLWGLDKTQPKLPIWDVTIHQGKVEVIPQDAPTYPSGTKVRIGKTLTNPNINGVWKMTIPDDNPEVFQLNGSNTSLTTMQYANPSGDAYYQKQLYQFDPMGTVSKGRLTSHKVSVPFGSTRRSKKRKNSGFLYRSLQ